MRALLATLSLVLMTGPTPAEDRYSGYYAAPCGRLQCDLLIEPAGADAWSIAWAAIDPRDPSLTPICALDARVAIGKARMGDVEVGGVAVGEVRGEPVALFDLDPGRISVRTRAGCEGIAVEGIYVGVGD